MSRPEVAKYSRPTHAFKSDFSHFFNNIFPSLPRSSKHLLPFSFQTKLYKHFLSSVNEGPKFTVSRSSIF